MLLVHVHLDHPPRGRGYAEKLIGQDGRRDLVAVRLRLRRRLHGQSLCRRDSGQITERSRVLGRSEEAVSSSIFHRGQLHDIRILPQDDEGRELVLRVSRSLLLRFYALKN